MIIWEANVVLFPKDSSGSQKIKISVVSGTKEIILFTNTRVESSELEKELINFAKSLAIRLNKAYPDGRLLSPVYPKG